MMQPLETQNNMDDAPQDVQDAVSQLSFAYKRGEEALTGTQDEALTEGIRRAEAILFAAGEPLSASQISHVLPQGVEPADVLMALRALYAPRGVSLVEVAGKWRFQTAQDLAFLFVEERQVQKKLGQAALETLAIIAYGQPVTRAEIEAVRGVAVSKSTMDTLLETGWVKVAGQRQTPGLPMEYKTTADFLEHFGLESLNTLPGKADLEAEGLLSDVIPEGLMMPDEEALSEEETLIDDNSDDDGAADQFVTNFMDEDAEQAEESVLDAQEAPADVTPFDIEAETIAVADETPFVSATKEVELTEAWSEALADDLPQATPYVLEVVGGADDPHENNTALEDPVSEDGTHEGVSVFSYLKSDTDTTETQDSDGEAVAPDDNEIQAAIIKLRKETREPQRPMSDWTDED